MYLQIGYMQNSLSTEIYLRHLEKNKIIEFVEAILKNKQLKTIA